jgi:AcrR family transcriptional regulator
VRTRLSRDDWTAAALRALATGGLAAVAIEPLAAALGATKGSGYWHFANRADLVNATLQRWEHDHTAAVIAQLDSGAPPQDRLADLFRRVMGHTGSHSVEVALLASAADPAVADALQRVTGLRLDYLAGLFGELGFGASEARHRAVLAYTSYLGHAQLARAAPAALSSSGAVSLGSVSSSAVSSAGDREDYLRSVLAVLTRH